MRLMQIDRQTGTTFWTDAINKEMKNVRVAFEALEGVTEEGNARRQGKTWFQVLRHTYDI